MNILKGLIQIVVVRTEKLDADICTQHVSRETNENHVDAFQGQIMED
jgi:hypothetical protein